MHTNVGAVAGAVAGAGDTPATGDIAASLYAPYQCDPPYACGERAGGLDSITLALQVKNLPRRGRGGWVTESRNSDLAEYISGPTDMCNIGN